MDDHYQNYTGVTEDINKAIKATARTNNKIKTFRQDSLSGSPTEIWPQMPK